MRCAGELYVSGGTEEYADPPWSFVVRAECNGGQTGDCGFSIVLDDDVVFRDSGAWGFSSTDIAKLQEQHLAFSQRLHGPGCTVCDSGVTEFHRSRTDKPNPLRGADAR